MTLLTNVVKETGVEIHEVGAIFHNFGNNIVTLFTQVQFHQFKVLFDNVGKGKLVPNLYMCVLV